MIHGIGIDIVEVSRIQAFLDQDNQPLLSRLFTPAELAHCLHKKQSADCLAGRFAAKEAFVKALGSGLRDGLSWVEMEIVNNPLGKPELLFSGKTAQILNNLGKLETHLSISHDGGKAVAMVVLEVL